MDIDPRRLRVLRAVSMGGGVMDAARLLHLTPSAVSQQLALLEREVGVPLVDRSRRRIALTRAGSLLAVRAERVEAELAAARQELAALSGRAAGRVVVAGFPTAISHLLVPALERLARSHPEVLPSFLELEMPEALRELRTESVDAVLIEGDGGVRPLEAADVTVVPLLDDEYRVVVPARWPRRMHSFADLAPVPWVAGPPDTACGRALSRLARAHRFSPRRAHTCLNFPTVLTLVAAGLGAAIVPLLALRDVPASEVVIAPIPGVGFRRLSVMHRAGGQGPEPVVGVLVEALRQVAGAPGANSPGRARL